jgi:methylthioribulose-1-phosphate dehydratase
LSDNVGIEPNFTVMIRQKINRSARGARTPLAVRHSQGARFSELAAALAEIGRGFYGRGWALGTSGNFSAVVRRKPLHLAITSTAVDKSGLSPQQILEVQERGRVVRGHGQPSTEAAIHFTIVRMSGAGSVLHTHSVYSTLLSEVCAAKGGVLLEGYEMLKGLEGVTSHEHREWLPILENSQDMARLSETVRGILAQHPGMHGFLLRQHGLYTWGAELAEAKRHVEILEFLLEVMVRSRGLEHLA